MNKNDKETREIIADATLTETDRQEHDRLFKEVKVLLQGLVKGKPNERKHKSRA